MWIRNKIIKMIRKRRKGQIGTTLTWFVAFIIIFFIMLIFVSLSFYLAATKKTFEAFSLSYSEQGFHISQTENLIALLNTKVEIEREGKKEDKTITELIKDSVDDYISKGSAWNYKERGLYIYDPELRIREIAREKNRVLFENSKNILNNICSGYILVLPQGVIYKQENSEAVYAKDLIDVLGKEALAKYNKYYSVIPFEYKGYIVKIKYLQLEKC